MNKGIDINPVDCFYWHREGRTESDNWHDENLGEQPKVLVADDENSPSVFGQLKKMFS